MQHFVPLLGALSSTAQTARGSKPSNSLWACWSSYTDTLLLPFAPEWQPLHMYNPILLFLYPCSSWRFFDGWPPLPSAQQSTQNSPGLRTFPETTKWKTSSTSPLMQETVNGPKDPFIFILFWINTSSYLWFPPVWEVSQGQCFQTWIEILIFSKI